MIYIIVLIICIAIGFFVSMSGMFSGGERFSDGKISSEASKLRHEAFLIDSSVDYKRIKSASINIDTIEEDLVDEGYLKKIPNNWSVNTNSGFAIRTMPMDKYSDLVCVKANKDAGFFYEEDDEFAYFIDESYDFKPLIGYAAPYCAKPGLSSLVPCCLGPELEDLQNL